MIHAKTARPLGIARTVEAFERQARQVTRHLGGDATAGRASAGGDMTGLIDQRIMKVEAGELVDL
jgi:hypothetical protein